MNQKSNQQMNKESLRHVGKFKDAHGLKGELFMIFFSKDPSWFEAVDEIYIEGKQSGDSLQKMTILEMKPHKDGLRLKLEGIHNRNQSDLLIGAQVYVHQDVFESEDGDSLFLTEIEGFQVEDQTAGLIGIVSGFSYNGAHDNLIIRSPEAEYEVPFVDSFVTKIDHDLKMIFMNLPEGLLEINKINDSDEERE